MSERYMYKLTYKPTLELARKFAWLDDDPRIGKTQTILMDAIEDTSVSLDSTISTHPQLNGEAVADHMYKNPVEVNISGSFSAYGGTMIDVGGNTAGNMMQWIQNLFEAIKDFAIVCTLVKVSVDGSTSSVRFKNRKNMVLQSITWTEKLMSMSYSFKFIEIMMATVQEYSVDTSDPFLPSIDVLQSISFTQEVMNWSAVDMLVVATCVESGWVAREIAEQSMQTYALFAGIGVAAGAGTIYLASQIAIAAGTAIPVAGWVVAGIIALGIMGVGIFMAIKRALDAKKFKDEQLKYYQNDDAKNRENVEKFNNFRSNIAKELLKLDDAVTVYSFTYENPCEFYVNFENNYYLCNCTKSVPNMEFVNSSPSGRRMIGSAFYLKNIDKANIGRAVQMQSQLGDLFDYKSSDAIYRLPYSGSYIYLLRKYDYKDTSFTSVGGHSWSGGGQNIDTGVEMYLGYDARIPTDTYYVVASQIAPEQFSSVIEKIVLDAIMR